MSGLDRWIIGALVMALSGVLWFLMVDNRADVRTLSSVVSVNSNRITSLESRTDWLEKMTMDMKSELREHREQTEGRH